MSSRLNLLMRVFSISGKDLSDLMSIDSSLVSKWRSGRRMLKPTSVYADKIVTYIIERDKPNQYKNICRLLKNNYEHIESCSKSELIFFLKNWLTSGSALSQNDAEFDPLKNSESVDISIFYRFHGNKGRRQAIKFMTDYAMEHTPGLERISYTEESAAWFYEDDAFLKEWRENNDWFLRHGNKITVIHPVDRTYETTAISMLNWMQLHMVGGTHACYIPKYSDESVRFTLFLIPDHLVLFSLSSRKHEKVGDMFLTNDPSFLKSIGNILKDFLDRSIPIFARYYFDNNEEFFNDLIGILETGKEKYIHSFAFLFTPLSEHLVKEILQYNKISGEEIDKIAELYHIISTLFISSKTRYFINIDKLERILRQDNTAILDSFSFIMGRVISVPHALFIKVIREALDTILNIETIDIGITDAQLLANLDDINILAQENTYANFFCANLETPLSLVSKELTVATGVYQTLGKIWNSIPRLKRNKEFVFNQIQEQLTAAYENIEDVSQADDTDFTF